jgi:hypothetical protein
MPASRNTAIVQYASNGAETDRCDRSATATHRRTRGADAQRANGTTDPTQPTAALGQPALPIAHGPSRSWAPANRHRSPATRHRHDLYPEGLDGGSDTYRKDEPRTVTGYGKPDLHERLPRRTIAPRPAGPATMASIQAARTSRPRAAAAITMAWSSIERLQRLNTARS